MTAKTSVAISLGGISSHSRDHLREHIDHFGHMLSEQGPMSITFVHNNTLFGLQKLQFEEAIGKARSFHGGRGYLENQDYRDYYAQGRITDADIAHVMGRRKDLKLKAVLANAGGNSVTAETIMRLHLIHGISASPVSELRSLVVESRATRRLCHNLPEQSRAAILASSNAELNSTLDKLGDKLTLAGWLQDVLNLDVTGYIRDDVQRTLADGGGTAGDATVALRALKIPAGLWPNYQAAVDSLAKRHGIKGDRDVVVRLWLRSEQQIVDRIARCYFDTAGTMNGLSSHFKANQEEYAALGLWAASLRQCGVRDPFAAIDAATFQEQDVWSQGIDHLSERYHSMQRWSGPPVPLDPELRSGISDFVKTEIARLDETQHDDASAVERAQLCWTVLHDLGETSLNRRGFEALIALASTSENADIIERVSAQDPRQAMLTFARQGIADDIASLSSGKSHADFLQAMTGENIVERVNDYMIGLCSSFLDEGLAAWHLPGRALGFYESWRNLVQHDRTFDFDGVSNWRDSVYHLPIMPVDAVISQLQALGIAEENWADYCGRLMASLKGWAGMVYWRQLNPNYSKQQAHPIDLMQYLAVRLFYQNILVSSRCRKIWQVHSGIDDLKQYFNSHPAEYIVRKLLHSGKLPDHLAEQARFLAAETSAGDDETDRWKNLADMAWMHHESGAAARHASNRGWRLFQLAQFLGLDATQLRALPAKSVNALVDCLDSYPEEAHGPVWLHAFELHYRNEILNAMSLNRGRGRWLKRDKRPKSQVVFCIDEREESIHRHFEELDPEHETMGAAGFFGVAMDYTGLDDHRHTPLCPAVVTPAHKVMEVARPVDENLTLPTHVKRGKWLEALHDTFWEMKRNVLGSYFLIDFAGFLTAYPLLGRVFFPVKYFAGVRAVKDMFVPSVKTRLTLSRDAAPDDGHAPLVPLGFTVDEQADRVEGLLRNIGLIAKFAPIVVFCAHGSTSQNNPHENAHDCGACGGKQGAPNSRAVAGMANIPAVRDLLRKRGINIPDDTWFVGAVHNTASDLMSYYDEDDIPEALRPRYQAVVADLHQAAMRAARERCRRFASSPKDASLEDSYHHANVRAHDFSQVRPEWGHATNAFAVVGRRALTQGVFFDRRPFIISYDPTTDPTGKIVERILLAVGPVGAGINLEYYFSTVDSKIYGSGTKVPHNVTGLVGIMEGAHSDLRTGLPRQMTEVHEAMRLNLIVDAPMAILGEIYGRQPGIQELLNGEWVILIAHDPETGAFNQFVPGVGFEKWDDSNLIPIPEVTDSYAWFKGKYEKFLPPSMITEPAQAWQN